MKLIFLYWLITEMLEDKNFRNLIRWTARVQVKNCEEPKVYNDNEFQIVDPYEVARLWGIRRSEPSMNYKKFKRILRYYYNKSSVLRKIPGKRNIYCFQVSKLMRSI